jgi:hypothetical protein
MATTTPEPVDALITENVCELWRKLDEIFRAGDHERWETDDPPGRQREWYDARKALYFALGFTDPAIISPFDATRYHPESSAWYRDGRYDPDYFLMRKLGEKIDAAAFGRKQ